LKTRSILLIATSFLLTHCGNNKAAINETQLANNSSAEKKDEQNNTTALSGEGIVGTWKLCLEVFDDNDSRIPDEDEMKKGFANNYHFGF